jgi:hypothetical protein
MSSDKRVNLRIKVTNLDTNAVYFHGKVPLDHVEMIKMNKNLRVEVLGQSRGASYDRRTKQGDG